MIDVGDKAPAFTMKTEDGGTVSLKDYKGKILVLFFYPRDDTPGCTKEAIGFSEMLDEFEALGASVLGVSRDTPEKHAKFRAKHELTVPLASDEDIDVIDAYGSWVEKNMYGKKSMGIERSTFVIDGRGKIRAVFRKVRVPGHVEKVLETVKELD